jgi:hypothetical protein
MATGYPALAIRPPESPLQQYAQIQQIQGGQQQIQAQQLENQIRTRQLQDQDALTRAMTQWDGKSASDLPMLVVKNGGSGQAAMSMTQNVLGIKEKASEIAKNDAATNLSQADALAKNNDALRGRILNVAGITDPAAKQVAWDSEVSKEEQAGTIQPGSVSHTYPGDTQATALANHFALGSQLIKEANEKETLAQGAWKPLNGQLVNTVTGERIGGKLDTDSLNSGLQTRWQVLNPGQSLPDWAKLNSNSTPMDFDRVDKLLEATEKGKATQAQQATVNAIRAQTFQLATAKEGYNWVTGTATQGPSAGKVVAVPQSDIQKYGIQDAGKMEDVDITKTQSGRQWLTLANKQAPAGAPPEDKGIGQLIDELDKDGKLGPLAGRWQEFMAGKFGAGDPEYTALRTKLDLSNTLLATVHSGRLGPFLMENMQQLANAGKMDGATLKSAFKAEQDYVTDRAMDPNPPSYGKSAAKPPEKGGPPPGATMKVPGSDGKLHWSDGKKDLGVVPDGQ